MELRSTSQRTYKQLELTLKGYGIFEDGMALEEMEQIILAMELSSKQLEENRSQQDLRQALFESEMDFAPLPGGFLSSTMIGVSQEQSPTENAGDPVFLPTAATSHEILDASTSSRGARDCDSPVSEPIIITVRADVHHPHNWSPSERSHFQRKRLASEASSIHDSIESSSKRSHISDETPNSGVIGAESSDSGINWDDRGSSLYDESPIESPCIEDFETALLASTSSAVISERSRLRNTDDEMSIENLSYFGRSEYSGILQF